MSFIDDPEHLRLRAADMRGRADRAMYPETKQGLLRIAGDYDVLATRAEQRIAGLRKLAESHDQTANPESSVDQNPNQFALALLVQSAPAIDDARERVD